MRSSRFPRLRRHFRCGGYADVRTARLTSPGGDDTANHCTAWRSPHRRARASGRLGAGPTTGPAGNSGRRRPPTGHPVDKVQATAPAQKADKLAEWERLRQQVRAVRQARGTTLQALAGELGLAASTVESALQKRRRPSLGLQQHLTDWLAAPAVAAMPEEPFRPNGAGHVTAAGDGVDRRGALNPRPVVAGKRNRSAVTAWSVAATQSCLANRGA